MESLGQHQLNIQNMNNQGSMADFIVNNLIYTKIGDVLKNEFTLSFANITKLFIIMSTGEIKNGITASFGYAKDLLKKTPHLAFHVAMSLSKMMSKKPQPQCKYEPINRYMNKEVNIETEGIFMIALYNYLHENVKCKFNKTMSNIKMKNTKDNIFVETLSDIVIPFGEYKLQIGESLLCEINNATGEIVSVNDNFNLKVREIKSFVDFLDQNQKKVIHAIYDNIAVTSNPKSVDAWIYDLIINGSETPNTKHFTELSVVDMLVAKYPSLNREKTISEYMIFSCIMNRHFGHGDPYISFPILKGYGKFRFDPNETYKVDPSFIGGWQYTGNTKEIRNRLSSIGIDYKEVFKNMGEGAFNPSNNSEKKKLIESLKVTVCSTAEKDFDTIPIMDNLLKEIYGSYKKSTTKTKIFTLHLEDEITTREEINPEYTEWEEKKKLIKQFKEPDSEENNNHEPHFNDFFCRYIPKRTITKKIITKKVVSTRLNEMEKDFETLYLREKDKKKLTDCLDMFKNKGHIMKELGLQNKFNLMLYGEPGTGKSTTIQAVANYLEKDIYYISLKNVKYNEDLQLIFEFVNKNVPNPGCLIMEDIDAMTPIVLKRKFETIEYKVSDIMNNQQSELTLEYLLNILQGTLTIEGGVFIVTTNHLEYLDPAFYRDGRFDVKIELKLCDHYQIKMIYKKLIGSELSPEILNKIPENKYTPATLIYHIKNYIFNVGATDQEIMAEFMTI